MSDDEWRRIARDALDKLDEVRAQLDEALAKLAARDEELADSFPKTWGGLLAFLDSKYPVDIFKGIKDTGPQIVTLTRALASAQERAEKAEASRDSLERIVRVLTEGYSYHRGDGWQYQEFIGESEDEVMLIRPMFKHGDFDFLRSLITPEGGQK